MADNPAPTPAQVVDTFMQRSAIGLLLIALKFAVTAGAHFLPEVAEDVVDITALLLSIAAVFVILPSCGRYLAGRKADRTCFANVESYLAEMFREAAMRAFSATFVLLIGLHIVTDLASPDLPTVFFLDLIIAVMTGAAAISYFILVRGDQDDADDELDSETDA